jgi:guanosine-3',5'-bis(diphosphate) 3'-pyrophosphohydrolase
MDRLLNSIYYAISKHNNQLRKDKRTPYISHSLSVGILLTRITKDEEVIIAGILHDVMEECDVSYNEIKSLFGNKVADIVMECSELNKQLSWKDRKELALEKIAVSNKNALLVKSADILHNTYEIMQNIKINGISSMEIFNVSLKEKIIFERRRYQELKRYILNNELMSEINDNLTYIEQKVI